VNGVPLANEDKPIINPKQSNVKFYHARLCTLPVSSLSGLTKMGDDLAGNSLHLGKIVPRARKIENEVVDPLCYK
jgi:hypothetical protein